VPLRRREDAVHVFNGVVLRQALTHQRPGFPVSLSTSFCGSMKTTAVSRRSISIVVSKPISAIDPKPPTVLQHTFLRETSVLRFVHMPYLYRDGFD
jgi:hypothetical protein